MQINNISNHGIRYNNTFGANIKRNENMIELVTNIAKTDGEEGIKKISGAIDKLLKVDNNQTLALKDSSWYSDSYEIPMRLLNLRTGKQVYTRSDKDGIYMSSSNLLGVTQYDEVQLADKSPKKLSELFDNIIDVITGNKAFWEEAPLLKSINNVLDKCVK